MYVCKLHQSVWQRVRGLCPDPLKSPREGKEERRIEGGREVAWTPKIYDIIAATGFGHPVHLPGYANVRILHSVYSC